VIRKPLGIVLLISGAALLLAILQVFRPPEDTLIWQSALDAGHVPLFGLISLIALGLVRALTGRRGVNAYILAFLMTSILAAVTEGFQYFGPRDADPGDLARSMAGSFGFLSLAMALDRQVGIHRGRRIVLVVGAAALIGGGLAGFTTVVRAHVYRAKAFPTICSFDASWEKMFWGTMSAEFSVIGLPQSWSDGSGNHVGKITLLPSTYPGFYISELEADWRGYDSLCFDVYSELSLPVEVTLRVHDARHDNTFTDRFNRVLMVVPGKNELRIRLEDIRDAPRGRELDLAHVRTVSLFAVEPDTAFTLYLDAFRLEAD